MRKKEFDISVVNRKTIDEYLDIGKANKKSVNTIKTWGNALEKLGDSIENKRFKDVTEKDLREFFSNIKSCNYHDLVGGIIIRFYKWLFHLKRREIPEIMEWYRYTSKNQKERLKDPDIEKLLITPEEYKKIMGYSKDAIGMWEAFWETMYISGGRPDEVRNMQIKDVKIDGNRVLATLINSKKTPRIVPMMEQPQRLIRWLEIHPERHNPKAPLWVSYSPRTYGQKIGRTSINRKLIDIRNRIETKKSWIPYSFRKTRATILFSARTDDGARIYDNRDIGDYMGWDTEAVEARRKEYELTKRKDVMEKFFNNISEPLQTSEFVSQENKMLKEKHEKEIEALRHDNKILVHDLKNISRALRKKWGENWMADLFELDKKTVKKMRRIL